VAAVVTIVAATAVVMTVVATVGAMIAGAATIEAATTVDTMIAAVATMIVAGDMTTVAAATTADMMIAVAATMTVAMTIAAVDTTGAKSFGGGSSANTATCACVNLAPVSWASVHRGAIVSFNIEKCTVTSSWVVYFARRVCVCYWISERIELIAIHVPAGITREVLKNSLHAVFTRHLRGNHVRYMYGIVLKYTVNTGESVFFLVVGGRRVFKFHVWNSNSN